MRKVIKIKEYNKGNGGKGMNPDNLFELLKIILYFTINSSRKVYKTKLNKLLFYTQFLYYKEYQQAWLNNDFKHDYYGPVLEDLEGCLMWFDEKSFISFKKTVYGQIIVPKIEIDENEYTREQERVLNRVLQKFDYYTSKDISEYSHNESLWIDTEKDEIIPVEEAERLNVF